MEIIMEFKIKAIPKGRPRFVRKGNFVQTYTPAKTHKYEKEIAEEYQKNANYMFKEPISVTIDVEIEPAKSLTKKKKSELLEKQWHKQKPDVDNLAKAILDGLNGVAYSDDSQIQILTVTKKWSWRDCTTLTIKEMK